jgi:mono/diheme cytochrome c family protein
MRAFAYVAFALLVIGAIATTTAAPTLHFTAAQATAGEPIFNGSCAQCHGVNLEGAAGPALAGPAASGLRISGVFTVMTTQMPYNNPGTLKPEQYVEIMAYILKRNGMKPSGAALTAGAASSSTLSL